MLTSELRTIEALARDREDHGFAVLSALRAVLLRALEHPHHDTLGTVHEVLAVTPCDDDDVLGGSEDDAADVAELRPSVIAGCAAAVAFLVENGFTRLRRLRRHTRAASPLIAADGADGAIEMADSLTTDYEGLLPTKRRDAAADAAAATTLCLVEEIGTSVPLPPDRKAELVSAVSLVQWAAECNTGLLTLRVCGLKLLEGLDAKAEHRIEVGIEWEDELGKRQRHKDISRVFLPYLEEMSPSKGGKAVSAHAFAVVGAAGAAAPRRQDTAVFVDGGGESELGNTSFTASAKSSSSSGTGGGGNHHHYRFDELFSTHCDRRCDITVALTRRRTLLADKLLAFALFEYSNFAALSKEVELRDPDHPERLPIGRLRVAVDSVAHRCFAKEAADRLTKSTPQRLGQYVSPARSPARSPSPTRGVALPTASALTHQPEAAAAAAAAAAAGGVAYPRAVSTPLPLGPSLFKSPPMEGARYDADDYY